MKWLWLELNLRPWAYESPALTAELQSLEASYFTKSYHKCFQKEGVSFFHSHCKEGS